jgi:hypothetical protein
MALLQGIAALGLGGLLLGSLEGAGALQPREDEPIAAASPEPEPSTTTGWESEPGASGGWDDPEPTPAPRPQPVVAPAPTPATAPAPREMGDEPRDGLAALITGPILIALGIPLSFAGNVAWRNACGPDTSDRECARGTTLSVLSHTGSGLAFTGGIALTAIGARQRGTADAWLHLMEGQQPDRRTGLVVSGAIILPGSLVAMGLVRLFFWLPTPQCEVYSCVVRLQTTSTLLVSGLALTAGLGAGLMAYGVGYNKGLRRWGSAMVVPAVGPGFGGLGMTGRF